MTDMDIARRRVLDLGLCAAATMVLPVAGHAADGAAMGPQPGDVLVKVTDASTTPLVPLSITRGYPPILAWPMDPATRLVRNGARFNQVLLYRLRGDRDEAHGGRLVAFSAVCTHAGCIVSSWRAEAQLLLCPCHGSEYDPVMAAAVVAGPAPLPLPSLPLVITNGLITVAGPFSAKPGGHTGRTD